MATAIIPGNVGKDAEYRTANGSELCSFSVASEVGYGDNKQTLWFDVARWGKGAEALSRILRKGSKVTVVGEMSTREHNGKTYLQCRADKVTIHSAPKDGERREPDGSQGHADQGGTFADELDDSIPFLTSKSVW